MMTLKGWQGYGVAIGLTFAALLITLSVQPLVRLNNFELFQGAVFLSVWFGGLGPGLLAALLSIGAIDSILVPSLKSFSLTWTDRSLNLLVFGTVALVTSSLSARLKRAKADLEKTHDQLEMRLEERTEELLQISNREQTRIGQDLHDGLCQTLAGIRLLTDAVQGDLRQAGRPEADDVRKIEDRLREALAQADSVSRGLYPVELETNGLMAALHEMAVKTSRVYPVDCHFVCRMPVLMDDHVRATHLYRIAQEAVMNAIKSGKAKHVTVRLFRGAERLRLIVADNGIGFQMQSLRGGMGLQIMRYRAQSIRAGLEIRSRKSGGTVVSCVG